MQRVVAAKVALGHLCDSHCHIQLSSSGEPKAQTSPVDTGATQTAVTGLVICGTHPQIDWDAVERAVISTACVPPIVGFGVHPWFVPASAGAAADAEAEARGSSAATETVAGAAGDGGSTTGSCGGCSGDTPALLSRTLPDILADLTERLLRNPHAIVAEVGLDKLRGPPEAAQAAAFIHQLRLAAAHQRPVSVHCVRHYGLLVQILQDLPAEDTPPAIIVHAFTGSLEIAKALLNLKNKKRTEPVLDTAAASCGTVQQQQLEPKRKTRGGATAHTVRIKERIFFGVGLTTSFTVKNFATQTLPLLLRSQRVLLETDAHYTEESGRGAADDGCCAAACVYVNAQEHAGQLGDLMKAVEAAAMQSAEMVSMAQERGVGVNEMTRDAVAAAYAAAFASVLV